MGAFGFAGSSGYQEDSDSNLKLLGHRYYDPSTGRFLARDPAYDGRNWYGYCANNPAKSVDPSGDDLRNLARLLILWWQMNAPGAPGSENPPLSGDGPTDPPYSTPQPPSTPKPGGPGSGGGDGNGSGGGGDGSGSGPKTPRPAPPATPTPRPGSPSQYYGSDPSEGQGIDWGEVGKDVAIGVGVVVVVGGCIIITGGLGGLLGGALVAA